MPTYDYQCQACKHQFSAMHKISETAPNCPECGGEVRKMLSAPAVHGKGGAPKFTPPPSCGAGKCCCH